MGLLYNVIHVIVSIFSFVLEIVADKIFSIINNGKKKTISKVEDPLLLMPATVLAEKIRSRELRAEDVMSAFIARTKEVNCLVNAVIGDKYDEALRSAQELDAALDSLSTEEINAQYSREAKPLLGVPMSVKGCFFWTGMTISTGVISRQHLNSDKDASVLKQLKDAGAILFVQTNVPELCFWMESSNNLYGCTNNPYDLSRGVGGSSGGEGCLIGAGASVLGIGSDIGGSIRIPSAFNGIFGHKPSPGVANFDGHHPPITEDFIEMFTTGPMCRYAVDLIPALKVMAKPEVISKLQLDSKVDVKDLRIISVPDDSGGLAVSPVDFELKAVQRKVSTFLRKEGAEVTEQRVAAFRHSFDMWFAKFDLSGKREPWFTALMAGPAGGHVNVIKELLLKCVGRSEHTVAAILFGITQTFLPKINQSKELKDMEILDKLRNEMIELLGENGVLLYPIFPKIAPYHNRPILSFFDCSYAFLFNSLGFPVTQCTLGLSKTGLPMGIQVVAAPHNDRLTLALASVLEKEFGGWVSPGSS